ncbi:MAG: single-stranded-DNA-specific exonuclease RecJ [Planctomycetota bacterium]|nr:MAG: single-stranded-DNA-specific exonuclease RecJ [Planctomycetota bacterium]
MPKLWRIHPHDSARVVALERSAAVPAVVAQLLLCRGIHDATSARHFLEARLTSLRDPEDLPGAAAAADRIMRAIEAGKKIVIYGDYDVDGMSGTAILYRCLQMLGAAVRYYVPHRIEEGYGLNFDALTALASQGAGMIVTVDCGATSAREAAHARGLGLELVVTDHHHLSEALPEADAIVHPALPGSGYPFTGLCGAGVAFKLAWALCQRASQAKKVSPSMRAFLMQAVGLAALGTVADVVPLVDENRVLVRHGLTSLRERPVTGAAALWKLLECEGPAPLSSEDIAFKFAPRLNAAGRLGQATLGVELLTTDSSERADALAAYLHELNASRESLERSIYLAANKQATEQFDPEADAALVLAERGWHPGVIGIVASRLAEKFHRPVVLIALDAVGSKPGIGSARSAGGLPLHAAFTACSEHLLSHGGHAAAAGLRIDENCVDAFRTQFCEFAAAEMSDSARTAELRIDAEVPFSALTTGAVADLERLAPFGESNPRPLLCASNVTLGEPPRPVGGGQRHLSLRLVQHGVQFKGIAFGGGEWADELAAVPGPIAVAFRPFVNHFRGRRSVELQVCDWQPATAASEKCA